MIRTQIIGLDKILRMYSDVVKDLTKQQVRALMVPAARKIINAATKKVSPNIYGEEVAAAAVRDIGLVNPKGSDRLDVFVGLRGKLYWINNDVQKVLPIVRHMTTGFKQTNRAGAVESSTRKNRGKVRIREPRDFIADGFESAKQQFIDAVEAGIEKKIKKRQNER